MFSPSILCVVEAVLEYHQSRGKKQKKKVQIDSISQITEMGGRKWSLLVFFFILLIVMEAAIAQGQGNGNGNGNGISNGNGNDKGNDKEKEKEKKQKEKEKEKEKKLKDKEKKENEKEKEKEKKEKEKEKKDKEKEKEKEKKAKKHHDEASNYDTLEPLPSGQERGFCRKNTTCEFRTIVCPSECANRKPKKQKACFINCGSSKCEATCKVRKANCDGYGALCYDPRFVGGDGVMFYFHGAKGGNFAIVSDDEFQINAHFIGTRPQGRTRDYTWVQALAVMFDTHTLVIAANRVSHWNDKVDSLIVKWDGEEVNVPTDGEAEWRANGDEREVVVERTDDTNSVRVTVADLVEMDITVKPIGEQENKVHNYQLPSDDAFAHLETQFRFKKHTRNFEGVLGQTYRPGYVSPVKRGVAMPMMGGENKYKTLSLFSTSCNLCRFQRPSGIVSSEGLIAQY